MSRPQGINPVAGGVLAYQQGLRTSQATPLSRDEMIKIIQEITDLEQAAASIEQQTIKTFGQIASQSQQAKAEVISAYASGFSNVKASEQIKLKGNMDMAIKLLDQLEYSNPTFTAENAKNLEALSGAGKSVMTGRTDKVTPEQYVNDYIDKYKEAAKDVKTGIGNDLSKIRISYNRQEKNSKDPEERIALARQAVNDTQEAAMTGAMEAIAGKDESFRTQVEDLLIQNSNAFTDDILPIDISQADLAAVQESREDKIRQVEELTRDFRRVGGIGRLDDLIDAIGTTALDEIVNGGIKGMADQMKDVEFAPETRRSIQFLKDQLKAGEVRMDAFDTAVAQYNSIPGVPQLRDALGMNDDIFFAQYMSKVPAAFNDTLLKITKEARAQGIEPQELTADQMRGLVARQLATGEDGDVDVGQAARLSNNQFRMRRMLATDVLQGGRRLARQTARTGLGQAEVDPEKGFVAPAGADKVDLGFAGEGIDVKEPVKPKVDTAKRKKELKDQIALLKILQGSKEEGSEDYNNLQKDIDAAQAELNSLEEPKAAAPVATAQPKPKPEPKPEPSAAVKKAAEEVAAAKAGVSNLGDITAAIAAKAAGVPTAASLLRSGTPEDTQTGPTTGETPPGLRPKTGGLGGLPKPEPLVDLSKAGKGIMSGPNVVNPETGISSNEGQTLRDIGAIGTNKNALAIMTQAALRGQDLTLAQAQRMSKFLRDREAANKKAQEEAEKARQQRLQGSTDY